MAVLHKKGFTLVEAIVSVVILATATPGILWAVREAHRDRVSPVKTSYARWLITERLEDIIADRHSTTRGYTYLINSNYPAESSITSFPGFTRSTTINETGPDLVSVGTGFKTATVTVGWTDARGVARSLAISTVITDYTP
jgi:type II secretory pathway pseudopilin PulG